MKTNTLIINIKFKTLFHIVTYFVTTKKDYEVTNIVTLRAISQVKTSIKQQYIII